MNIGPATDIAAFLADQQAKDILRFITCGSVDDGKSTLIGRLLYESKNIFDDQLSSLEGDSRQYGTQGERLDLALLVDGLQAEREQGITIDVAYRFFATDRRRFIGAAGVTALEGSESGEVPRGFAAFTLNVYAVPLVSPMTSANGVSPLTEMGTCAAVPMKGVTV